MPSPENGSKVHVAQAIKAAGPVSIASAIKNASKASRANPGDVFSATLRKEFRYHRITERKRKGLLGAQYRIYMDTSRIQFEMMMLKKVIPKQMFTHGQNIVLGGGEIMRRAVRKRMIPPQRGYDEQGKPRSPTHSYAWYSGTYRRALHTKPTFTGKTVARAVMTVDWEDGYGPDWAERDRTGRRINAAQYATWIEFGLEDREKRPVMTEGYMEGRVRAQEWMFKQTWIFLSNAMFNNWKQNQGLGRWSVRKKGVPIKSTRIGQSRASKRFARNVSRMRVREARQKERYAKKEAATADKLMRRQARENQRILREFKRAQADIARANRVKYGPRGTRKGKATRPDAWVYTRGPHRSQTAPKPGSFRKK